jgi:DNA-binding HxlR family transcriptional regulator
MKIDTQAEKRLSASLSEKLRRGNVLCGVCPSRDLLKHLTNRWGVLVLIVLEGGTHRFSELRRAIDGVNERMLAQTLQLLEQDGIVDRVAFNVVPPHVEYSLTPLGKEAAEKVRLLADWIETNITRFPLGEEQASSSNKAGAERARGQRA